LSYQYYRVFCSSPGDLEPERRIFEDAVAELNETELIPQGVLFVPVSVIPNIVNLRFYQPVIEQNLRDCTFFVQLLGNTWGAPPRDFEWIYSLACGMQRAPDALLREVAVFVKSTTPAVEASVSLLRQSLPDGSMREFEDLAQLKECLRAQLSSWSRVLLLPASISPTQM
jgi:hypothetical protein